MSATWPPPRIESSQPGPSWGRPAFVPSGEPILVRSYGGKPEVANALFAAEAAALAEHGYVPISQVYAPGSWGAGAFIIALLLLLFVVGILVLLYLLMVKPAGTLMVTYQLR